jgi:glycosyltransferase involved in cell wall biosynthesis
LFASQPAESAESPVPADGRVAFLGRMTRLKGGDLLIRAVHDAAQRLGAPVPLLMMGDGPQRMEWESLAARLEVPCTFSGWVSGRRRWELLRRCSVAALPSIWPEPFGLVGLEAGAVGVPTIAADVGGVREWLRDGTNGILVPAPASPASFGAALARLLSDPTAQRRLRAGATRMASEMTVARHVDRLEPVLRAVDRRAMAS